MRIPPALACLAAAVCHYKVMRKTLTYIAAVVACACAQPLLAQVTIGEAYHSGDPFTSVGDNGYLGTIFQAPTSPNDLLTSFNLYYSSYVAATAVNDIYAWNGTSITGPALYQGTANIPADGQETVNEISYTGLNVALTPGQDYVLTTGSTSSDGDLTFLYYQQSGGSSTDEIVDYSGSYNNMYTLLPSDAGAGTFTFDEGGDLSAAPESPWFVWGGLTLCAALACIIRRRALPEVEAPTAALGSA